MNKYIDVSERIKAALEQMHMSQQELAEKSGVSKNSISQYCNGKNTPGNVSAKKISDVLKCNPLWLMGFDVQREPFDEQLTVMKSFIPDSKEAQDIKELEEIIENMTEDQVSELLMYARFLTRESKGGD